MSDVYCACGCGGEVYGVTPQLVHMIVRGKHRAAI